MAYNSTMTFPGYEYCEYPKWIETGTDRFGMPSGITVYDADEEALVLKTKEEPVRDADEKARLILLAEVKGVQIDKRWNVEKLTTAIMEAGFDATFDPTK